MKKFWYSCFLAILLTSAFVWAANESSSAGVTGTWQISWEGRQGQRQGTLQLKQDGSRLTGTFQGERGSVPLEGSVKDNDVSFKTKIQGERRSMTIAFTGTLDGDKVSGTVKPEGGFGHRRGGNQTHSWSATRKADDASSTADSDSK